MFTRVLGTPLLGVGLIAMLGGCGSDPDETDKPPPTNNDDTAVELDPNRPTQAMITAIFGWDNAAGEVVSIFANGNEIKPVIEVMLVSQYVDLAQQSPTQADVCFALVDFSSATVSDWDEDGTFPLALELAAGADVSYNCPGWDFATWDPAEKLSSGVWTMGVGALELNAEYLNLLKGRGFFNDNNKEERYAGGFLQLEGGFLLDRAYSLGWEVDESFSLVFEGQNNVPIDKYSMAAPPAVVSAAYELGSHYFFRL